MAGSAASKLPGEGRHRGARRQELIDAAITSIAEHGLARTTVARVAEAAGQNPLCYTLFSIKNRQTPLIFHQKSPDPLIFENVFPRNPLC